MFTDVAVLRVCYFAEVGVICDFELFEAGWREDVWGGEDLFTAFFSDAGFVQFGLVLLEFIGFALFDSGFDEAASFLEVGAVDISGGGEKAGAFLDGELGEESTVGGHLFEQFCGGVELSCQRFRAGAGAGLDWVQF